MLQPDDQVVRAMFDDGSFRIIAARTTRTTAGTVAVQKATGTTAEYLGMLVTSAILFRETMAPGYRVQAILRGSDEKSTLVADSHPTGDARGLVQLARGKSSIRVAKGALLQMMRSLPNGDINRGVVELPESGSLSEALMSYMETSEQVTSMVGVTTQIEGDTVLAAGGYMVQLLPEANRDGVETMVQRLDQLGSIDRHIGPDFSAMQLVELLARDEPFTLLGSSNVRFNCWCSDVRVMSALATLDRRDIEEMIAEGDPVELNCDYCNTTYRIPPTRLQGLLQDS